MTTTPANDAFERFARAHLPGKIERAIYPVVASTPDRDWAPGEVAAAAGVSNHEADQALRRFASAGIVDHRHVRGHGHRYRWHADMAYLRGDDIEGLAIDPVCGMPVPPGTPHTAVDGDDVLQFCSLACLVRWRSNRRRRTPS